jgi:hypothetical protein
MTVHFAAEQLISFAGIRSKEGKQAELIGAEAIPVSRIIPAIDSERPVAVLTWDWIASVKVV